MALLFYCLHKQVDGFLHLCVHKWGIKSLKGLFVLVLIKFPLTTSFNYIIIDGGHLHPKLNCGNGVDHISTSSIHRSPTIPRLTYLQF
jgi:hypothetical protein